MSQCEGTTRSGTRCRRDARPGSAYCSIHAGQADRADASANDAAGAHGGCGTDMDDVLKTALGFAVIAAIILLRLRR